jgi:hypothetical protein
MGIPTEERDLKCRFSDNSLRPPAVLSAWFLVSYGLGVSSPSPSRLTAGTFFQTAKAFPSSAAPVDEQRADERRYLMDLCKLSAGTDLPKIIPRRAWVDPEISMSRSRR